MSDTSNFRETSDGEILPVYEGINGPVTPHGADMAEVDSFLDNPGDGELGIVVPPEFMELDSSEHMVWQATQKAKQAARRVVESQVESTVGNEFLIRSNELADQRDADRAGTYPGTSAEPRPRAQRGNASSNRFNTAIRTVQTVNPKSPDRLDQAALREAHTFLKSRNFNPDDYVPEYWR